MKTLIQYLLVAAVAIILHSASLAVFKPQLAQPETETNETITIVDADAVKLCEDLTVILETEGWQEIDAFNGERSEYHYTFAKTISDDNTEPDVNNVQLWVDIDVYYQNPPSGDRKGVVRLIVGREGGFYEDRWVALEHAWLKPAMVRDSDADRVWSTIQKCIKENSKK